MPTGIAFGEVGKVLGAKWKELSEEGKKQYEDLAVKDKERYEKQKAEYEGGKGGATDAPVAEEEEDDDGADA